MNPQGPDIALGIIASTVQFWRSAQSVADIVSKLAPTLAESRKPKISKLEAILFEEDVLGFNISMDYAEAIEEGEGLEGIEKHHYCVVVALAVGAELLEGELGVVIAELEEDVYRLAVEPIGDELGELAAVCLGGDEEVGLDLELYPLPLFGLELMLHSDTLKSVVLACLLVPDFAHLPLAAIPYSPHDLHPLRPALLFFHLSLLQCLGIVGINYNLNGPLGSTVHTNHHSSSIPLRLNWLREVVL